MDTESLKARYQMAIEIEKEVGAFLLSHENLRHDIKQKATNDFVTVADQKAEDMIEEKIKELFPQDSILGEENGVIASKSSNRWIIDPIDGTVDFMASFPNYTISIAFEDEDGIAFGIVYVVRQGELFSAFRGEGAYLNGKRFYTDEETPLDKQLAILVPPHRRHEHIDSFMVTMRKFYEYVSDLRSVGSAACSLCYVAIGRVALYYERALKVYDVAAGLFIVKEAGGKVTLLSDDENWIDIVASSSFCHEKVLEIIND